MKKHNEKKQGIAGSVSSRNCIMSRGSGRATNGLVGSTEGMPKTS